MKILVTGALGNVGRAVLDKIADAGHEAIAFDIRNNKNRKRARIAKKNVKDLIFGNILDKKILQKALSDCDCVIHLAAIVPPESEKKPDSAHTVNLDGTKLLIECIRCSGRDIPVIYSSSASIMGPTQDIVHPVNTSMEPNPSTAYEVSKFNAEQEIVISGLRYCILRLASVLDSGSDYSDDMLELLFEFPLDARNEVIMDSDAALALVNAAVDLCGKGTIDKRVFFIGGGEKNGCRITNRGFVSELFTAMGIGMLSENCFSKDMSGYHMDWYDTEESQNILQYQQHSFTDFIDIVKKRTDAGGVVFKTMAPRLKKMMQMQSPYYKKYIEENENGN